MHTRRYDMHNSPRLVLVKAGVSSRSRGSGFDATRLIACIDEEEEDDNNNDDDDGGDASAYIEHSR